MEFDLPLLENPGDIAGPIATFWTSLNTRLSCHMKKMSENHGKPSLLSFLGGFQTVERVLVSSPITVGDKEKVFDLLSRLSQECLLKFILLYERHKFFTSSQSTSECACQFLQRLKQQHKLCYLRDSNLKLQILKGVLDPDLRLYIETMSERELSEFIIKNTEEHTADCCNKSCNIPVNILNEAESTIFKEKVVDNATFIRSPKKSWSDFNQSPDEDSHEGVEKDLSDKEVNDLVKSREATNYNRNESVVPPVMLKKQLNRIGTRSVMKSSQQLESTLTSESKPKNDSFTTHEEQSQHCPEAMVRSTKTSGQRHSSTRKCKNQNFVGKITCSKETSETRTSTRNKSHKSINNGRVQREELFIAGCKEIRSKSRIVRKNAKLAGSRSQSTKSSKDRRALKTSKPANETNFEDKQLPSQTEPGADLRYPEEEGILACNMCHKFFKRDWFLQCHKMLFHSSPETVQCTLCPVRPFSSNAELLAHVRFQHRQGQARYVCSVCEKPFSVRAQLREHHKAEHLGRAEFSCSTCPKKFKSAKVFQRHLVQCKINSNISYPCSTCDQSFSTKKKLERHERSTHTGEKPFTCKICQSCFTMKCDLTAHMGVHDQDRPRPYQCHVCGKTFLKRYYLPRHMLQHQNIKNFRCEYCGNLFTSSYGLRKHCWRKHGQPQPKSKKSSPLSGVKRQSAAPVVPETRVFPSPSSNQHHIITTEVNLPPALQKLNVDVSYHEQIVQDLSSQLPSQEPSTSDTNSCPSNTIVQDLSSHIPSEVPSTLDTNSCSTNTIVQTCQSGQHIGYFLQGNNIQDSGGTETQEVFTCPSTGSLSYTTSPGINSTPCSKPVISKPFLTVPSSQSSPSTTCITDLMEIEVYTTPSAVSAPSAQHKQQLQHQQQQLHPQGFLPPP